MSMSTVATSSLLCGNNRMHSDNYNAKNLQIFKANKFTNIQSKQIYKSQFLSVSQITMEASRNVTQMRRKIIQVVSISDAHNYKLYPRVNTV